MLLVLADIHFGKSDPTSERAKERALIRCIDAAAAGPEPLDEVVLLGDVFEHFIEYRFLAPKGFSRFLGRLATLADDGVAITYFAGNHDPWHIDYFEREFGARFVADSEERTIGSRTYHFFHGDGSPTLTGLYKRVKWLLRHPVPVGLYKALLPGDAGMALARWVNTRFSATHRSMETVVALREYAAQLLEANDVDVVVLGHSHYPEKTTVSPSSAKSDNTPTSDGVYLNPGSWHYQRTFATISASTITLLKWTEDGPVPYEGDEDVVTIAGDDAADKTADEAVHNHEAEAADEAVGDEEATPQVVPE